LNGLLSREQDIADLGAMVTSLIKVYAIALRSNRPLIVHPISFDHKMHQ